MEGGRWCVENFGGGEETEGRYRLGLERLFPKLFHIINIKSFIVFVVVNFIS